MKAFVRALVVDADTNSSNDVESHCADELGETIMQEDAEQEDLLEPWVDWLRRTTRSVEEHLDKLKIESWVHQARRRKWNWAARVANMSDDRWTKRLLMWRPELHFDGFASRAGRRQARPKTRYDDELSSFVHKFLNFHEHWTVIAQNAFAWSQLADRFVEDDWRTNVRTVCSQ